MDDVIEIFDDESLASPSKTSDSSTHHTFDHPLSKTTSIPPSRKMAPKPPKVQDIILSVLRTNNQTSLQSEFARRISKQIKKSLSGKRGTEYIEDAESNRKRPRLTTVENNNLENSIGDADQFVNQFLNTNAHTFTTTNAGQVTCNEVQQQKEALLSWFSDKMCQIESAIENHILLQDSDTGTFQTQDQIYQTIQKQLQEAIQVQDWQRTERLLNESKVQYERVQKAMKEDLLLMKCRHFNERSADHAKISELMLDKKDLEDSFTARMEESRQTQTTDSSSAPLNQEQASPLASALVELRVSLSELKKENAQLVERNKRLEREHQASRDHQHQYQQQALHQLTMEKNRLQTQLHDISKTYNEKCIENNSNKERYIQTLRQVSSLGQQLEAYRNSTAAQMGLLEESTQLSGQTMTQAQEIKSRCDEALHRKDQEHLEELRKLMKDHWGQMQGQKTRMEHLANKIKQLDAKGRDRHETMHEMAMELNQVKAQNEALQLQIAKLTRQKGENA